MSEWYTVNEICQRTTATRHDLAQWLRQELLTRASFVVPDKYMRLALDLDEVQELLSHKQQLPRDGFGRFQQ